MQQYSFGSVECHVHLFYKISNFAFFFLSVKQDRKKKVRQSETKWMEALKVIQKFADFLWLLNPYIFIHYFSSGLVLISPPTRGLL